MPRERWSRVRSLWEKPLQEAGWRLPSTLPAFLGIGAQKSGTTWLHTQLATHPSLFLPEEKECHYFDWNFHRPLAEYGKVFLDAGDRIPGEITPGYAILPPDRIRFVSKVMPEVRIVYLMRDPVERAWSQVVMNEIEIGGREPESIEDETWLSLLSQPRVRRRGDHAAVLDAWSRVVPSDRLLVGWFEEISEDPNGLLSRVQRFLGVDPRPASESGVIRRGRGIPMPTRVREGLVKMLMPELTVLAERFGGRCGDWLERWSS